MILPKMMTPMNQKNKSRASSLTDDVKVLVTIIIPGIENKLSCKAPPDAMSDYM